MSDEKEIIESLKRDVFMATANRGLVYTAILTELRKELGDEKAGELFKRAIYNHGLNMAKLFDPPDTIEEFKNWLLDFFPAGGAMNEPEVIRCDKDGLDVKVPRCPLKEGWRMFGLNEEEVADMCRHADSFDLGFFGSFFDYSMDLWSTQPDDACILHFRPKSAKDKSRS
jgi:hypothetical protein